MRDGFLSVHKVWHPATHHNTAPAWTWEKGNRFSTTFRFKFNQTELFSVHNLEGNCYYTIRSNSLILHRELELSEPRFNASLSLFLSHKRSLRFLLSIAATTRCTIVREVCVSWPYGGHKIGFLWNPSNIMALWYRGLKRMREGGFN